MNKLYNYLLLACLLLSSSAVVSAQEAEFVKLSKEHILNEDGSQEFRCNKELKLFTHTAMNSTYGETFIVYNPDFQELKIHTCYTKQKDGTIIKAPENAFVEVLPRFATDAPAYNHLKEMVVVHTGLDLGCTIYLDYSILTKAGYYSALDIDELIQETSPIRNYQITISVPENIQLNSLLYGSAGKATEQSVNGKKAYSWKLSNIPAASRKAFLPQNKENIPRLTANTFTDSKASFSRIEKLASTSVSLESETFAQFLTEKSNSTQEKLDIIHKYIVNNISTTAIPLQYAGYNFRSADEVIRSAYGTVMEKANLLNKMLNAAGIPSEIAISYPATIKSTINGLAAIKQIAVKTAIDGKEIYLSATSITPIKPEFRGDLDNYFTLTGETLKTEKKPAIYNESKDIQLDATLAKNGYLVYTLPPSNGIDKWGMSSLNSKREDLFETPSEIQEQITYTITIPEGAKLISSTAPISISTSFGKLSRTIKSNGNKIEVICSIELNKQQYSSKEYQEIRKLIVEWNSNQFKQLVFNI